LHEYDAIRDEILLRLGFQQQIIQYSFLVIGLLAALLSLRSYIDPHGLLAAMLVGPIICIFLQLAYFKQHVFIELLSSYIAADLGKMEREKKNKTFFSGLGGIFNKNPLCAYVTKLVFCTAGVC